MTERGDRLAGDVAPERELGAYLGSPSTVRIEQILDGLRFQQAAFFAGRSLV